MQQLASLVGEDKVMFASNWPHPEGLDEPLNYSKYLDGIPSKLTERVMHTRACEFTGAPKR